MTTKVLNDINDHHHDHDAETSAKVTFGFWIYIMSDCVLFAIIFATYAVLQNGIHLGPSAKELFDLRFVLTETFILLISSFTFGLTMLAVHKNKKNLAMSWLFVTFLLGAAFIAMEIYEFYELIIDGHGPSKSAFLSAFFTLVGTHGLHVSFGLIWIVILFIQVSQRGLTPVTVRKLTCLGLFWHFLDIVWIFVFTIVYLMGAI